jgi:MFS family permease
VLVTAAGFSQFFLLTLYMQQVMHYSALQTGVGFISVTLAIIVFANVAQMLVSRFGLRPVLTSGLLLIAAGMALLTQLPADGHYFWDLFPAFLVSGIGMAFTFVPMTIAGLTGVSGADAGVASGLLNTSRQIGGAVGLAAVSTVAATGGGVMSGFHTSFDVLTGLALLGALVAVSFVAAPPRPATLETEILEPIKEAA